MIAFNEYSNAEKVICDRESGTNEIYSACHLIMDWFEQDRGSHNDAWTDRFSLIPAIIDNAFANPDGIRIFFNSMIDRKIKIEHAKNYISKKIASFILGSDRDLAKSAAMCLAKCCGEFGEEILSKIRDAINYAMPSGDK
jgi:hypothetical protein